MSQTPDKHFTPQELAAFDGTDGKPVYLAHKGVVYDVTGSKLWKAGKHMNRHRAGGDMGLELTQAPHAPDVLERFPRVGVLDAPALAPDPVADRVPAWISRYMKRFPMLKRHPHPMTVHFPIAFCVLAPLVLILALVTGWTGFDAALLVILGAAVLFTPVAIATGLFTWWLNYAAARIKPVLIKLAATPVLFLAVLWAFIARLKTPDLLAHPGDHLGFILVVLALLPLISLIGWFGAALTFPPHDE
ncbi:cytochrome b5 [Solidesulfovibrio carbinoliphilus subsp. oakridgensis]|uniref:Cytochrome b5 n=1 Tax=Solidesulfovibrio carbinoliphilus subsp. oakridgensis TaxID=694327 RepID=G7Q8T9_9BACT|nr:DUF2231 domain-containing protein [Solidesulfovibrio carbinoliphilus]EHJ47425.1 cytochrome b5 [Solidesulfovibrio carbinoliphilus subsp. oakridgensis]